MNSKDGPLQTKYKVTRSDCRDALGCKHDACDYFVLDLTHDKFAADALLRYADVCREEFPILSGELKEKARDAMEAQEDKA